MKEQGLQVSRATVYNTLDLLVEHGLVSKHQFGRNLAQYEKSYGYRQHDHVICTECTKWSNSATRASTASKPWSGSF